MALTPKIMCVFHYREERYGYLFGVVVNTCKRPSLTSLYMILISGFAN